MTAASTASNEHTDELRVEFCGEEYSAMTGQQLSFGRAADIMIDDNRFLHRVLGEFRHTNGLWWLHNVGSSIGLSLNDDNSASTARIAPGTATPIAFEAATLRFEAGGTTYEMALDVLSGDRERDAEEDSPDEPLHAPTTDPEQRTATTSSIPLTADQFTLLVALAGPILRGQPFPTNRHIAASLEWTVTKFNRKLDGLCAKYTKAGVAGLHGSSDRLAKDRRTRLAEHVIEAGIVTLDDIEAAEAPKPPDAPSDDITTGR